MKISGRGAVVARTFGVGEVVGSNPTGPTLKIKKHALRFIY